MMANKFPRFSSIGTPRLVGLIVAFFVFLTLTSMTKPAQTYISRHRVPHPTAPERDAIFEAASNRTLGLDSIFFINLPHRHDRFDAMALQSHVADIQYVDSPAVDGSTLTNQGMPPIRNDLLPGEKGCFRAHANVWQHMVKNKVPIALILESDAGFDVKLRPIMGRLNRAFRTLLKKDHPTVAFDENNTDDPWFSQSNTWDMLSVGQCLDSRPSDGSFIIYNDPDATKEGFTTKEKSVLEIEPSLPRDHKRVVYRANSSICTSGYILTLSGAARLLMRTSLYIDAAVDLMISWLIESGDLRAYNQRDPVIHQWVYVDGIGKSKSSSDIHGGDDRPDTGTPEGWERLTKNKTPYKDRYENEFNDFALTNAWNHIFGKKNEL